MKETIILFVIFAFLSIFTFSVAVSQEVKKETEKNNCNKDNRWKKS